MNREEFMQEARETARRIIEGKKNGIMNLVQQAWAEGKRNAETETITALMKQAFNKVEQKGTVTVKAHDEWISVNDRLPDKSGRYLCWFGKNTMAKGAEIVTYIESLKAFGSLKSLETYPNVTHWMPLPEPPNEIHKEAPSQQKHT